MKILYHSKNKTGLWIIISSIFICLSGCQKAPINGKLDGQWQVMEVFPEPEIEIINERLYFNFYMHVCQLTYYAGYFMDGNMLYEDDNLYIDFPYSLSYDQKEILKQYGILSNPVNFSVEFQSGNIMILQNEESTIKLRKN